MSSEFIDSTLPERLSYERVATGHLPSAKSSDPPATARPSRTQVMREESAVNAALEAEIDAEIAHFIRLRLRKEAELLRKSQDSR